MTYWHSFSSLSGHCASIRSMQLAAHLQTERMHTRQRRLARRWAPHLMHLFGIPPHESALVYWLTDAACATNAEAIMAWIQQQMNDANSAPIADTSAMPKELSERLERLLNTVAEAYP